MCETNRGLVMLREFSGNENTLNKRARLLEYLHEQGVAVDNYILSAEGEYIVKDEAENAYVLSNWFKARECDIKNVGELCLAVKELARVHKILKTYPREAGQEFQIARNLLKEYDKHNRELKKIRNYLYSKRRKNDFEILCGARCQEYLEEGVEACNRLKSSGYEEQFLQAQGEGILSHGQYNYHNVYVNDNLCCLCGFEQTCQNIQIVDLYTFMRKIMEKYNYDMQLGYLLIDEYDRENTMDSEQLELLGIMFSYPEKFWKLLNYYFNSNKAWISSRNMEKLMLVIRQNNQRRTFLNSILQ